MNEIDKPLEFRAIALVGKYQSPEIAGSLLTLAAFLQNRGIHVLIEEGTSVAIGPNHFMVATCETIGAKADLVIVIGGDGTMMNTARRLAKYDVPLVGVNQGRLGFLTDIAREGMLGSISSLLAREFSREQRGLLDVEVLRDGKQVFHSLAMNELVVDKGELGHMIELEINVDGEFVYVLRADGVIVATPTGSTAYALSANGPILHPSVQGIALVPLCPHALTNRPITLSNRSRIEIMLIPPYDARIHSDGQACFNAHPGDCVRVGPSSHSVTLMHPPGYSYLAMLREKLHWSVTRHQ